MKVINIDLKKKFLSSTFGKGVLFVAGGTIFSQIVNLIFTPIITRIFTPQDFGLLTIYTTILGLLSLVAFKYEMGIPISKKNENAINLLALCIIILFIYSLIIGLIFNLIGENLLILFNAQALSNYWYLIPIGIFLTGLYKILYLWATRIKDYKNISKTAIGQGFSRNISKVLMGLLGLGGGGLIVGEIIGQSAGTTQLSKPILREKSLLKKITFKKMIWCLKRYKDFPIFNLPTHIISTIGEKAPIIYFSVFFSGQIVGYYGLAYSIVKLPMNLIGKAVGDVFYAEAASIGRDNPIRLKQLSNNLIKKLILLGFIPLLVLLALGPQLFGLVFGDNWTEAGVYAQIISVMLFFVLVFAPISRVYEVYEKQRIRFYIDLIRILLVLLVFIMSAYYRFSPYLTLILYTIVISLVHFLIYFFAQKIIDNEIRRNSK